ncbi:DUF4214 domain-containing protein [Kamptonema sp. UHCC 0994]|uniref:DUF4214 domain-containing protein n=1 Tax=Kamptonema sp. UHCC 0994 TaxID=3031329 RepID=UPI0023BA4483|nr:DUF4214 domain-containing protein [Kamptonema sp. UHCC 0994]MDF0556094.1 DUF4214 domain-containing protein [Kamptonema sp. UHCC 0994]
MNNQSFLQVTSQLKNEDFLEKVYCTYLKRDSDIQGKKFFLSQLENDKITRPEILTSFLTSPEFHLIHNWEKSILEMPDLEIILYHVPKTAGTTFFIALVQVYGAEKIAGYLNERIVLSEGVEPKTIKAIQGHVPARKYFRPGKAKEIIWLRHPIQRLISLYCYWLSTPPAEEGNNYQSYLRENNLNIVEFAQIPEIRNEMSTYIGGRNLTDFYFVGIQEFFKDDLIDLAKMLNWPEFQITYENKNKHQDYNFLLRSIQADSNIMKQLIALNSEDLRLYQTALDMRLKRKQSNKQVQNLEIAGMGCNTTSGKWRYIE